jgi:Skp family chaperone for outer membrane proteins
MKRSMAWVVGLLALGAATYFGSKLWAKPAPPAGTASTRVALLNLRWVIKNYDVYKRFMESMKKEEKEFVDAMQVKQKQLEALAKQAENLVGQQREAKEREMKDLQREMEELKTSVRKAVGSKSNEAMVKVYKAVREAATQHAKANGFALVLHFEGAAEEKEVDSDVLIQRNMNSGGAVPLYWDESLNISVPVLEALNKAARAGGK